MCFGYGFPDPSGYVIASLEKGDEITLQAGFGTPAIDQDRVVVVYTVDGFSALCTDGTILLCGDGQGVAKTNRKVEAKLTLKVAGLIVKSNARKASGWLRERVESIKGEIWWAKYKLKRFGKK
jgi:hypothetical protein